MKSEQTKRIAEILGINLFNHVRYTGIWCHDSNCNEIEFDPNSDFAIMRMIEHLRDDGYVVELQPLFVRIKGYDGKTDAVVTERQTVAECFLQAYGGE